MAAPAAQTCSGWGGHRAGEGRREGHGCRQRESHRYVYSGPKAAAPQHVNTGSHVPTAEPGRCPVRGRLVNDDHEPEQHWKLSKEKHDAETVWGGKSGLQSSRKPALTSRGHKGRLAIPGGRERAISMAMYMEGLWNPPGH